MSTRLHMGLLAVLMLTGTGSAHSGGNVRWPDPADLEPKVEKQGDNPWLAGSHPPVPENRSSQWRQEGDEDTHSQAQFPDPDYSPYRESRRRQTRPQGEYLPDWPPSVHWPGVSGHGGMPWGGYPPPGYYRGRRGWYDDGGFPFFDGGPWDFGGFPFSPFSW